MRTDPYRPSVRDTPPNDVPFIFKSGDVFPAWGELRYRSYCDDKRAIHSHVETEHGVPQLDHHH